jgi:hypothetical protein
MAKVVKEDFLKCSLVKDKATEKLFKFPNVVAVGVGYKKVKGKKTKHLAIIVSVEHKIPIESLELEEEEIIPALIDGVKTDVIETGKIKALKLRTDKWRPASGGVSIGHKDITAGTLGCLVKKNGELYILSNNHVLANSNNAEIGDPIYQPGPHDGGTQIDTIAPLADFVPINFLGGNGVSPCPFVKAVVNVCNWIAKLFGFKSRLSSYTTKAATNEVDCAIAGPVELGTDVKKEILEIGEPTGIAQAELGMQVQKSGRTTGLTFGEIEQINVTVTVGYGGNKTAIFVNQIITGNMASGGDSGSGKLNMPKKVVGLLFAGSDQVTIYNPIQTVLSKLGVELA